LKMHSPPLCIQFFWSGTTVSTTTHRLG
jgi:hypothetical protein